MQPTVKGKQQTLTQNQKVGGAGLSSQCWFKQPVGHEQVKRRSEAEDVAQEGLLVCSRANSDFENVSCLSLVAIASNFPPFMLLQQPVTRQS